MSAVILPFDGRCMLAALAAMDNPSLPAVKTATAKSPRMSADRPKAVIVLARPLRPGVARRRHRRSITGGSIRRGGHNRSSSTFKDHREV